MDRHIASNRCRGPRTLVLLHAQLPAKTTPVCRRGLVHGGAKPDLPAGTACRTMNHEATRRTGTISPTRRRPERWWLVRGKAGVFCRATGKSGPPKPTGPNARRAKWKQSLNFMRKKAGTCPACFVFGYFFRLTVGVGKTNLLRPPLAQ